MSPTATLFVNARIWTLAANRPDAVGLFARHGRIEALFYSEDELRDWKSWSERAPHGERATVVDLGGGTVLPGPVDAHCHLVSYGMIRLREADLRKCPSFTDLGARLRGHLDLLGIRPGDGRWLLGRGFEQDLFAEGRFPSRHDLDAICPDVPLRITRVCGHALVANTLALRLAGLDPTAAEPGFPEGVITEARMAAVAAAVPEPTDADWLQAARWACQEAARVGFVGIHSLMAHEREVRALVDLRREGPLPVRVVMQLPYAMLESAAASGLRSGFGDESLSIGAIKLFSDGSLGARTAALQAPYSDAPDTSGELIYAPEELARRVRRVYEHGFQVCIHAIGDRAMHVTLDAMEGAASLCGPLPPRIEHASLVDAAIVRRMLDLGVGAAIQPQFARSDYWSPDRLGVERARGCYAFRTLWEAGVPLAGSTDCPVEAMDAMAAIGQLVHRPDWSPHEGIPLEATLRIFSEGSYRLLGHAPGMGMLAPGSRADFVVVNTDPRRIQPAEIETIGVTSTVVGGRTSFSADAIG